MRARGLEPPPLSGPGPKPGASASSATPAAGSTELSPTAPVDRDLPARLSTVAERRRLAHIDFGSTLAMSHSHLPPRRCPGRIPGADPSADVYQRLLRERIVFLGTEVDDSSANLICAQLLLLAAEDASRDISLYINSPGGSVTAGLAIYDTMQFVPCDVSTVCMGLAASMGQFLLCAGAKGKRFALPHSRILMHQPSGQTQGQATDIAIQAEQIVYLKKMMAERIAFHTGQPVERIEARLGPGPLVHRRRGEGLRLHRPGDLQSPPGRGTSSGLELTPGG